ncbi:MAG: metallophosphoesterase family protein [Anaerolineaceae bacterium]
MSTNSFRLLLLADTHIGLDHPLQPRVDRRRRGYDFLANFKLALQPALHGDVDLVVHGGDLFDRSRVPDALVQTALELLGEVAESGVPVFLVPGNHERSRIPMQLWRTHPNLHIFDLPDTKIITKNECRLAISGFPFTRKIGQVLPEVLRATRYKHFSADLRILCMHQAVEGAQVGPVDFTFRPGLDVIRGEDLPGDFCAVLSGHIHRAQTLRHDLKGHKLPVAVLYPGSVERTAFAEQKEEKGYLTMLLTPGKQPFAQLEEVRFHKLPARPMITIDFVLDHQTEEKIVGELTSRLNALDPESVVRIRLLGEGSAQNWRIFSAGNLRSLAPTTMNVEIANFPNSFRKNQGENM